MVYEKSDRRVTGSDRGQVRSDRGQVRVTFEFYDSVAKVQTLSLNSIRDFRHDV